MKCTNIEENAPAISVSNVISLAPRQRRARRQRRRAWWGALLLGFGRAKEAQNVPMPVAGSAAVVKFRRQAGAVRW